MLVTITVKVCKDKDKSPSQIKMLWKWFSKICAYQSVTKKNVLSEVSDRFYLFEPYKLIKGTNKQKHKFSGNFM